MDLFWVDRLLNWRENLKECSGDTSLHVVQRPSCRDVHWKYRTDDEDMTDPYEDEDYRVRMTCGHAISKY